MRFIIVGALIILIGFVPLIASGLKIAALEGAVSLFAIGLLVLLIGLLIRKLQKALE
ncbi:MAG: hypothetical protein ABSG45_08685 [Nitrososphaerales archaeon]|jgi:hypothetical protein